MNALLLLTVLAIATPDDDADAAAALALAQAQAKQQPVVKVDPVVPVLTYAEGRKQSLASGKGLLVYVGLPSVPHPAAVVCEIPALDGFPAKCIVYSLPEPDGSHTWIATMDERGNVIEQAKQGKAVQPTAADPFQPSFSRDLQGPVDAKRTTAGPQFNPTHRCPTCGATVTIISGRGPGGTHTHTCSRDGTTWYH